MRPRLAKLLVRLVVRLLADDGDHIVYLNTKRQEGPPGEILPFITWKEPGPSVVASFPKDEGFPSLGTPVPERVAIEAGHRVRRLHDAAR